MSDAETAEASVAETEILEESSGGESSDDVIESTIEWPFRSQGEKWLCEVYSAPRVGPRFELLGGHSLSKDIRTGWNAEEFDARATLLKWVDDTPVLGTVVLSPPCTMYSSLQNTNKHKMKDWDAKKEQGDLHLQFAMLLAKRQLSNAGGFIFEHPDSASSWGEACVKEILNDPAVHHPSPLKGGCSTMTGCN